VSLLLTPYVESSAPAVAGALRARLAADREAPGGRWAAEHPGLGPPRVLFNESVVLAVSFWELIRGVRRALEEGAGRWAVGLEAPNVARGTQHRTQHLAHRTDAPAPPHFRTNVRLLA
jgi:hypothetical protein